MAIAFDTSTGDYETDGTTVWSHTCTGSDRVLLVGWYEFSSSATLSSITYAGVAMTQLGTFPADGAGGNVYLYGLANPASGANDVSITHSASKQVFASSVSYTGVDQTTPFPDTETTTSTFGTSLSASITTSVNNSWLLLVGRSPSRAPTAGTDTNVVKLGTGSGDAGWVLDSTSARATGANSLAWSYDPAQTTYYVLTAFAPAGGGGATPYRRRSNLALLGVS